ncbi:hypothetical protein R3W88_029290 [Solanum pinnatisectum]|uniref:Aminoacyl-tRNA synthetase class II (G/ P/ S/T) domain-containing protein n=1 Tax=Solanum pinnatisectum TaxID=50273 RepID=A0AAV9K726_9SOLN|nr:hypothetical protein R3W88_029290 [Solanum pinnatisectum]
MVGKPAEFSFTVKDHVQLGKELDMFDFDAAAEVSGSKFYYLKNEAVILELGLVNWAVSEAMKRGFTPLTTPEIVRSSVVEKCGFQPRGTNTQSSLPLKYVAFLHCFRTEAGAAGTATRGLYRVDQFSKVEMFILCRSDDTDMASEDLGAPAYRKFDVEAWMPSLGRYGEISSASNCTDYQSRRLGIRYRPESSSSASPKKGKNAAPTQFVHTLNATACAVPRI